LGIYRDILTAILCNSRKI